VSHLKRVWRRCMSGLLGISCSIVMVAWRLIWFFPYWQRGDCTDSCPVVCLPRHASHVCSAGQQLRAYQLPWNTVASALSFAVCALVAAHSLLAARACTCIYTTYTLTRSSAHDLFFHWYFTDKTDPK
jgi:hypothetical protein